MKVKQKTCRRRGCKTLFTPRNTLDRFCSLTCARAEAEKALQRVRVARRRREAADRRERRLKLKTRSDWFREAQRHFNEWCRLRDKDLPCISCDAPATWKGQWHASHYRSVGACPELRFEPLNVWKSCSPCNGHKSGNILEYRIRLIRRIGQEKVEWLEGPHDPRRYTVEEIQAISAKYRNLVREMKKVSKLEASTQ